MVSYIVVHSREPNQGMSIVIGTPRSLDPVVGARRGTMTVAAPCGMVSELAVKRKAVGS